MRDDDQPSSVVCTNTLELGIDIGQLDLAVQMDSTHTVMSFVQRLGRTGRRQDASRIMQIYTSEIEPDAGDEFYERIPFSLLKSLAIVDLFLEGWLEPPVERAVAYNVLYHQMLSRLVETHGSSPKDLVEHFLRSNVFPGVTSQEYADLLKHLGATDHIEQLESRIKKDWDKMGDSTRKTAKTSLEVIQKQRNEMAKWVGSMKQSSSGAWEGVKKGFVESYQSLSESFDKAADKF